MATSKLNSTDKNRICKQALQHLTPLCNNITTHNSERQFNLYLDTGDKIAYFPLSEKWRIKHVWKNGFDELVKFINGEIVVNLEPNHKTYQQRTKEYDTLCFFCISVEPENELRKLSLVCANNEEIDYFPVSGSWVKGTKWCKGFDELIDYLDSM